MSTKIYDAFRVKKSVDLRELLDRMKSIARDTIAQDEDSLYLIHALSGVKALQELKKGKNLTAEQAVKEMEEGTFAFSSLRWIEECMQRADIDPMQNLMNVNLNMSIWFDRRYWYIKFFVNWMGCTQQMMNNIEDKCPELEDYHYQNQSDPPEGIPYHVFKKRDKKWEELTKPNSNYRNMMQFTVFDHNDFAELVRKYWWKGEKDLYKHLAYKFDKKIDLTAKEETL
jgi:hypothetical protein